MTFKEITGSWKWYHGKLTRDEAARILVRQPNRKDGIFLIRDCSSAPGDYVLEVWHIHQIMRFQLHCYGDNKFGIQDGPIFNGLDLLVSHYRGKADGLPCKLTEACTDGRLPPPWTLRYGFDNDLHKACVAGDINIVNNILDKMKNCHELNSRDTKGYTALHLACSKGDDDIVKVLLKSGAHVSSLDGVNRTPIFLVCVAGHPSTLRVLIVQGHADFHERSLLNGYVPLHEVAVRGYLDCIRVLLSFKASMYPRTFDGDTPKDLALKHGKTEVVELLDSYPLPKAVSDPSHWLHQNLDRNSTVLLLEESGLAAGSFLVRTSISCHGYFVLTLVSKNNKIFHFQISTRSDCWFYIDDGPLFATLPHLIDHYMHYADGLPLTLKLPIRSNKRVFPLRSYPLSIIHIQDKIENDFNHISENISVRIKREEFFTDLTPDEMPINKVSQVASNLSVTSLQTSILKNSLELGHEIGVGEFGSVLSGIWVDQVGQKIPVAMKTLHNDKLQQGEQEFLREARVMSQLNHSCIVRLLGVCIGPPMILITELVEMGALLDFIIDHQSDIIEEDQNIWASQISMGMMYLEQKRFVHRDLATRNILLASKKLCKISDFGLSRAVGAGSNYYQAQEGGRWPVKWYAPESINYGTFSHKSDVWSYGVTLWEIFTYGDLPYGQKTGGEVIAFLDQGLRLEKPDICSDHTYQVMLSCWSAEPSCRPTFEQLFNTFSIDP